MASKGKKSEGSGWGIMSAISTVGSYVTTEGKSCVARVNDAIKTTEITGKGNTKDYAAKVNQHVNTQPNGGGNTSSSNSFNDAVNNSFGGPQFYPMEFHNNRND